MASKLRSELLVLWNGTFVASGEDGHVAADAVIAHRVRELLLPILSGAQRSVSSELRARLVALLGSEE